MTYLCTVVEMIVCLVKLCLKEAFQFFCCYNHIRNEILWLNRILWIDFFSQKNIIWIIVWFYRQVLSLEFLSCCSKVLTFVHNLYWSLKKTLQISVLESSERHYKIVFSTHDTSMQYVRRFFESSVLKNYLLCQNLIHCSRVLTFVRNLYCMKNIFTHMSCSNVLTSSICLFQSASSPCDIWNGIVSALNVRLKSVLK